MENSREIVLDTLLTLEKGDQLSHRLIRNVLDKYDYLDSRDKAFIKRVTEGTLERRVELDHYLDHFSNVPVKKMKPLIRCLLRMSTYQILYMDAVPDSAVCNEACKLAAGRKFQNLKGYVNAVLRSIARNKGQLPMPDPHREELAYLCVRYSLPEWIVRTWLGEYGRDITEKIGEGLLEIHPVSLRLSRDRSAGDEKAFEDRLKKSGLVCKKNPYLKGMYQVSGADGLEHLQDFQEGRFLVQDASSVLAVTAAGIREGDFVIDVCGAPGGKAILASELAGEAGRVITGDVSAIKTETIQENALRLRRKNLEIRLWDGREPDERLFGKADVVILDVPCSGLGVMGKKRDIKYRVTEDTLKELASLQREIVANAWQYCRHGGILLYSTCTIRKEENRDMAEWILKNLPFEPVSLAGELPESIWREVIAERAAREERGRGSEHEDCMVQLLPGLLDMDGFFFAKFRRK